MAANIEWTFSLEFAELVWSDGIKVERRIIPAAEMPPFGSHEFKIPSRNWQEMGSVCSVGLGR